MGYKGFIRSINATANQIDRESRRKQKEYEKALKQKKKLLAIEKAKIEVAQFENKLDILQSMHKDCNSAINWESVKDTKKPEEPKKKDKNEKDSNSALENFKPVFFDNYFGRKKKKIKKLEDQLEIAKKLDEENYQKELENYNLLIEEWKNGIAIATKILANDLEAFANVIKEMTPFNEISSLGSNINFKIINKDSIEVTLAAYGDKIVPGEVLSLLKSGKISMKKMPIGRFNEIYQDHICSAVLRIARETFAVLPISNVMINVISNILNKETGHMEDMPILSVFIPKESLNKLNFAMIDPSDSMKNFVNNMNFKKSQGMTPIELLETDKYITN